MKTPSLPLLSPTSPMEPAFDFPSCLIYAPVDHPFAGNLNDPHIPLSVCFRPSSISSNPDNRTLCPLAPNSVRCLIRIQRLIYLSRQSIRGWLSSAQRMRRTTFGVWRARDARNTNLTHSISAFGNLSFCGGDCDSRTEFAKSKENLLRDWRIR